MAYDIYIYWVNLNERVNKRETVTYDSKTIYLKKSFGERFVDYYGSPYLNCMPIITK